MVGPYNPLSGAELRVVLMKEFERHCGEHPAFHPSLQHEGVTAKVRIEIAIQGTENTVEPVEYEAQGITGNGQEVLQDIEKCLEDYMRLLRAFKASLVHIQPTVKLILNMETERTSTAAKGKSIAMTGERALKISFERQYVYPDKAREEAGLPVPKLQMTADGRNMSEFAQDVDPFEAVR